MVKNIKNKIVGNGNVKQEKENNFKKKIDTAT